jgi:hypothetical protein
VGEEDLPLPKFQNLTNYFDPSFQLLCFNQIKTGKNYGFGEACMHAISNKIPYISSRAIIYKPSI